ncbi:MAG TPA: TIR domain-containing protein [Pseudonocardiaceae bacterium]|nr:TIR domain-containing protein [Pseudonocardiaceae bacterium]
MRRYVATLLGIGSPEQLAASLIERASLSGGRVESHEFGRDQHSSASAGAMLFGMAGIPLISDDVLAPFFRRVAGLVRLNGTVHGHDGQYVSSASSWSIAQVLLGLLVGARRLDMHIPRLHRMVTTLTRLQDRDSGGWALRADELPRPAFSFYPALALARVWRSGLERSDQLARSLAGTADYFVRCLRSSTAPVEELLLALRALTIVTRALVGTGLILSDLDLTETADSLRDRACSSRHGLLLRDLPIFTYSQPFWHMTLWRPLTWLTIRGHASPLSPLDALLGHELVGAFNHDVRAWCGPGEANASNGASWPSALALAGTFLLASDLVRHEITVDQWLNRCRELQSDAFEFDVAISFAGADRAIASEINVVLRNAGYRVFYDDEQRHRMLGEDQAEYLQDIFLRRCRYAIVVVSGDFLRSKWAGNWEWPAMRARMQSQRGAYVLPYLVDDDVSLPGLNPTIGFVTLDQLRPWEFAQLVVRKLRTPPESRDLDN